MQGTPPRYKLNEWDGDPIKGSFYEQELQRVTVRPEDSFRVETIVKRRRRAGKSEVLVQWKGWPEKYNSWIPTSQLE
ncbi:hypothetical protein QZH41_002809 [Actinostola sp. cb2023]|nr:hypothetical protein QZH41_002809 [Actinostola sp. cb2023]